MKKYSFIIFILICVIGCQESKKAYATQSGEETQKITNERFVQNNILSSGNLPKIKIEVSREFQFIGNFDFDIIASSDEYPEELIGKPIANGERFVFGAIENNNIVDKLFIVQFEGFLSGNDFTYNYNFDKAKLIGGNKYRANTWIYDSKTLARDNPHNEGAKTRKFLEDKGYVLEDDFMMSRWVGLASEDRKNEIIIYYLEMLHKTTGYTLKEYEESITGEEIKSIESALVERSKKSFTVIDG